MPDGLSTATMGFPFEVSIGAFATYSVIAAVLIQVSGYVIATNFYMRAGVAAASIPRHSIWGAGVAFAALTAYYVYIGAAVARMGPLAKTAHDNFELALYGIFFFAAMYALLRLFLVRWPGPGIYFSLCAILGDVFQHAGMPPYWLRVTNGVVSVPDLPRILLPLLGASWLYSKVVYPNLSRAVGGAAPIPVALTVAPEIERLFVSGSQLYEVLSDTKFMYLEMMLPKGCAVDEEQSRDIFDGPPKRFLQVPLSSLAGVERLHPRSVPPAFGKSLALPGTATHGDN